MSLVDIVRPHGRHRAVDEVIRLRRQMFPLIVLVVDLMRRLVEATAARDAANAKASQLRDAQHRAAEATHTLKAQTAELLELRAFKANATKVSDLGAHPAVAETQPIPVLPLHLSPLAGVNPSHVPGI